MNIFELTAGISFDDFSKIVRWMLVGCFTVFLIFFITGSYKRFSEEDANLDDVIIEVALAVGLFCLVLMYT
ncbi:hypothetical protein [Vibrio rotiferianus]|uniref:hypothetical protein n=1 Tax=Vibrio rotiferianus TaxID=190895 RepID=UPI0005ED5473|nr:hypothetical protein [Vibrio rotiferianus]